jgi:rod shape determining protein RodA
MIIFYGIGFFAMVCVSLLDYRVLIKGAPFYYLFGLALLVAVYFYGSSVNSAQGWFRFGGLSFQPAELFKFILILSLSYYLIKRNGEPLQFWRDVVTLSILTFVPFTLVMMQPDLGNALSYLVILTTLLWIGNMQYKHVLIVVLLIGALAASGWFVYNEYHAQIREFLDQHDKGYWLDRIDAVFRPDQASDNATYHVRNAKIAIGTGGLTGEGYLQGSSVQKGLVPYAYSDSIFVVIAEEFGFIGASALILLYFILLYRLILIALTCRTRAGAYISSGVAAMMLFQIFENIGMLMGISPSTGITLPFISYGGTSLLINMISFGFVQSIWIHNNEPLLESDELELMQGAAK